MDETGALGHEPRQQSEGLARVAGLDAPPQPVSAGEAGGRDGVVAQRAREPLPRRERGRALVRLVLVEEEERRHGSNSGGRPLPDHRGESLNRARRAPETTGARREAGAGTARWGTEVSRRGAPGPRAREPPSAAT